MSFLRVLCCLLLSAVLATACSSGESVDGPAAFDGVLLELFGTDDTEMYLADRERAAAELVVTCMNDAGFEFEIPALAETFVPPDETDLAAAQLDGFGIISGFRFQISQFDVGPVAGDPNIAYVGTLSEADFARFFLTLDGPDAEPGQRAEGGCNNQASDQAYADWLRFSEALPNFTALGEERDTHPDWLVARSEWQACMLDRGFDYGEPDAIRTDVISRMRETVNEAYPGGQLPLTEVDGVAMVDPEVDVLLDELVQFERAAAVANIECTQPLAEQFDAVDRLVQQAFVDRNQATIDELLAANR